MSFLFIKIGDRSFSPLLLTLARVALGTLVVVSVALFRREPMPRSITLWTHLAIVAALLNTIPFLLFAYAETSIASTLAGICNATAPLFTTLVSIAARVEPVGRRSMSSLVLGFSGVLVALWPLHLAEWLQSVTPAAMALLAAACYGVGWVYIRRFLTATGVSNVALCAGQLGLATAQLSLCACFVPTALFWNPVVSTESILSICFLGCFGTGLAYLLQYYLLEVMGATGASTITFFLPVVSIAAGALLIGEPLSWRAVIGCTFILASIGFIRFRAQVKTNLGLAGARS